MVKDTGSFNYCEFIPRRDLVQVFGKDSVAEIGPRNGFDYLYVNYLIAHDKSIINTHMAAYLVLMFCTQAEKYRQGIYYKAPVKDRKNNPRPKNIDDMVTAGQYQLIKKIDLQWGSRNYFNSLINTDMGVLETIIERQYALINGVEELLSISVHTGKADVRKQLKPGSNVRPEDLHLFDYHAPLEIPEPVELSAYQQFRNRKKYGVEVARTIMAHKTAVKYVINAATGYLELENRFQKTIGFPLMIGKANVIRWL